MKRISIKSPNLKDGMGSEPRRSQTCRSQYKIGSVKGRIGRKRDMALRKEDIVKRGEMLKEQLFSNDHLVSESSGRDGNPFAAPGDTEVNAVSQGTMRPRDRVKSQRGDQSDHYCIRRPVDGMGQMGSRSKCGRSSVGERDIESFTPDQLKRTRTADVVFYETGMFPR